MFATCDIVDEYYGTNSARLGTAYLVSVPAFNFDQVLPKDDPNAEQGDRQTAFTSGNEIILDGDTLYRKMLVLRLTIDSYGKF